LVPVSRCREGNKPIGGMPGYNAIMVGDPPDMDNRSWLFYTEEGHYISNDNPSGAE
jgi:hypothetical protein